MEGVVPFAIGSDVWPGLGKLIEEMAELQAELTHLIATNGSPHDHWRGVNTLERVQNEMGDVHAALAFFQRVNCLSFRSINERATEKTATFTQWHLEHRA